MKGRNHRAAQQLGRQRYGQPGSQPPWHAGRYPRRNARGQQHDTQRCQDGQEKPDICRHGRIKQQKNDGGKAEESEGPAPQATDEGSQPNGPHDSST